MTGSQVRILFAAPHSRPTTSQAIQKTNIPQRLFGNLDFKGPVPLSLNPFAATLHEREHDQRGPAPARVQQVSNDPARLSIGRPLDAERERALERRRDPASTGMSMPTACAGPMPARTIGKNGSRMMAWWADRCDDMKRGGIVVPLRA